MSVFSARFGIARFDYSRFDTLEGEISSKLETFSEKPSLSSVKKEPLVELISEKPSVKIITE